jgi:galactose mutarotase-like enzyme
MSDRYEMRYEAPQGALRASVLVQGAELCALQAAGAEYLWQAGAAWPRHAPHLFPIVGRLTGDRLRIGPDSFTMKQHGFARDRRFTWVDRSETGCRLRLQDDAQTRLAFPYAFRLDVEYALSAAGLDVRYLVENPGSSILPFSLGAHPAFVWPLPGAAGKAAHTLRFAQPEPAPVRRLRDGLLLAEGFETPVRGLDLPLHPALFDADAMILDHLASDRVQYLGPDGRGIELSWHGFRELGLWSRAGGDFLCIEPWAGTASPEGFDGDFRDKPGVIHLSPGEQAAFGWRVSWV